jgi:hypothetical protein
VCCNTLAELLDDVLSYGKFMSADETETNESPESSKLEPNQLVVSDLEAIAFGIVNCSWLGGERMELLSVEEDTSSDLNVIL